jgi:O-antigen/teichoic acid export membrane protein
MIANIKSLTKNQCFMRYVKNSSWMMAEYALKIISAIFVTIYIARYLGPENFGILSYALAIVTIFMAISRLGMESVLVRDLAKHPEEAKAYMGTAYSLMLLAAITSLAILSVLVYFFESDPKTKVYIWIIAVGLIFQTFLVVDYGFQAQLFAKYSSIAKSIALGISSLLKIYLVWLKADLMLFAIAFSLEHVIIALMLAVTHLIKKQPGFLFVFHADLVKPLLKSAWPMVLSALAIILYMRIDQVMIKNMLDSHQLGLYAAAAKIYEGWIIVPYVLSVSLLPAIVRIKASSPERYVAGLTKVFALLFWLGVIAAIIATLAGGWIIQVTFGYAYADSSTVLSIVMWTAAFTALGSVTARYLTVENMEKKIAFRTFVALFINVALNLLLIPLYGINGAAMATLITIVTANYLINYIDKDLKQLTRVCNDAILLKLESKGSGSL